MSPTIFQIILLGLVQGAAELLPVSSSAHVIAAEKLMGLDPTSPEMTFLLIMLHTGTMIAVIVYFWAAWKRSFFADRRRLAEAFWRLVIATAGSFVIYEIVKAAFEKVRGQPGAEIEQLFGNLNLIGVALAAAGILIVVAGLAEPGTAESADCGEAKAGVEAAAADAPPSGAPTPGASLAIGLVQGLCLPFRGFSRSGATISTGMLLGIGRRRSEEFSFALAVVLTPPAIALEGRRLLKAKAAAGPGALHLGALVAPGLIGLACSLVAGLLALKWLSRWLEGGRWHYFGIYCLVAAAGIFFLARMGF